MKFYNVKSLIVMAALCCSSAFAADATNTVAKKQKPTTEQIQLIKHRANFNLWEAVNGYSYKKINRHNLTRFIYKIFNDESLNMLINRGNVKAILTLADRHRFKSKRQKETLELYKLAAVYGSTSALDRIARGIVLSIGKKPTQARDELCIQAISWSEVAYLRGDLESYGRMGLFLGAITPPITLTPEDFEKAKTNAKTIYQELLSRRMALGLGDFDNTVPPSVKVMTERYYGVDPYKDIRTQPL